MHARNSSVVVFKQCFFFNWRAAFPDHFSCRIPHYSSYLQRPLDEMLLGWRKKLVFPLLHRSCQWFGDYFPNDFSLSYTDGEISKTNIQFVQKWNKPVLSCLFHLISFLLTSQRNSYFLLPESKKSKWSMPALKLRNKSFRLSIFRLCFLIHNYGRGDIPLVIYSIAAVLLLQQNRVVCEQLSNK